MENGVDDWEILLSTKNNGMNTVLLGDKACYAVSKAVEQMKSFESSVVRL
jgi:hypothetical protein